MRMITKVEVEEQLKQYIYVNNKIAVKTVQRIPDAPQRLRHACAQFGVTFLVGNRWNCMERCMVYYVCRCGSLYIYHYD